MRLQSASSFGPFSVDFVMSPRKRFPVSLGRWVRGGCAAPQSSEAPSPAKSSGDDASVGVGLCTGRLRRRRSVTFSRAECLPKPLPRPPRRQEGIPPPPVCKEEVTEGPRGPGLRPSVRRQSLIFCFGAGRVHPLFFLA